MKKALTGDTRAGVEGVEDVLVDFDQHILLGGHLLVAELDPRLDPAGEVVADHRVSHIQDPLLLEALPLKLEGREVDLKLRIFVYQLHYLLNREAFVLWAVDVLDVRRLEVFKKSWSAGVYLHFLAPLMRSFR